MKAAEQIETKNSKKPESNSGKTPRGTHPHSLANLVAPWTSETAPRNGGRPKRDEAQEIARKIFEENGEAIYKASLKALLKGNTHAFQVLSNRAYGKVREHLEVTETREPKFGS